MACGIALDPEQVSGPEDRWARTPSLQAPHGAVQAQVRSAGSRFALGSARCCLIFDPYSRFLNQCGLQEEVGRAWEDTEGALDRALAAVGGLSGGLTQPQALVV